MATYRLSDDIYQYDGNDYLQLFLRLKAEGYFRVDKEKRQLVYSRTKYTNMGPYAIGPSYSMEYTHDEMLKEMATFAIRYLVNAKGFRLWKEVRP
jgi:hypothetical protein